MPTTRQQKRASWKQSKLSERQLRLIAKALADPRRHQILQHVGSESEGVLCAHVRKRHSVTAATLSHHIKELKNAGLVEITREGKSMRLQLQRDVFEAYLNHLHSI